MKVLVKGHRYQVENLEKGNQVIQFIQKELKSKDSTELVTVMDGTTNEELLDVLVNRLESLNAKFKSRHNAIAIQNLKAAKGQLLLRTAHRSKRGVEGKATL